VGLELTHELKQVAADRDVAGRYLPALLDRALEADPALALSLCRLLADPTLRTFGAIHLYGQLHIHDATATA
jgi:hypothetical protein